VIRYEPAFRGDSDALAHSVQSNEWVIFALLAFAALNFVVNLLRPVGHSS